MRQGGGRSRELPAGIGPWVRGLECVWRENQCTCGQIRRGQQGKGGTEDDSKVCGLSGWTERAGSTLGPGAGL